MRLGYTIVYSDSVEQSLEFFEKAFGLKRRFYHESDYGELDTGATILAFATHELGAKNLPAGYVKASGSLPLGMEVALVTEAGESVDEAYKAAIAAGATGLAEPITKPWGQVVAYVRCPDGTLVELCSPVAP